MLIANYISNKMDFMDKDGNIIPSVANIIYPININNLLDQTSDSEIELETISRGIKIRFFIKLISLSSQENTNSVLLSNHYFINFKFINHIREYLIYQIQWLQENNNITYTHKSLGFFEDSSGKNVFLLEQNQITGGISNYFDSSLKFKRGSMDTYKEFVNDSILTSSEMQLALVLGFTSVTASHLEEYADIRTMVLNLCGASSTGKTTTVQFIASLWGDPKISNNGIVKTFNGTANAIFGAIEGRNGIPLILDDATTASYLNKTQLIYQLAQGEPRARMSNYGKDIKQGLPWSGLALITSETPVLSESETRQGLIARVIDTNDIVWTSSSEHSTTIKNFIYSNHGHLGPEFVNSFMTIPDDELKKLYDDSRAEIYEGIPIKDNLTDRIVNKLAIIYMTAILTKEIFDFDINLDKIKELLIEFDQSDIEDRHIALKAYDAIKHYVIRYHSRFEKYDDKGVLHISASGQLVGVFRYSMDSVVISIPSSIVKEVLQANKMYEYKPILKYWGDNNLIAVQGKRNTIKDTKLTTRAVKFRFERDEETMIPWHFFNTETKNTYLQAPVSDVNYESTPDQIDDIFKESDVS